MSDILLKALREILEGSSVTGRWLNAECDECSAEDDGAEWEPYTDVEQAEWIKRCAEIARAALAAYELRQSAVMTLPDLPVGEYFDSRFRRQTFSSHQMETYARAAVMEARRLDAPEHMEGVLIVGSLVDGFRFIGPFACESDAAQHAASEAEHKGEYNWSTATMVRP